MSLGRDEVLHVARLAELGVPDAEVDRLVQEFNRIIAYVEQLGEVTLGDVPDTFVAGPAALTLREDVPGPAPLARGPAAIAPEFEDGFFTVPRHGGMEDH